MDERKVFPPPKDFSQHAHVKSRREYEQMYDAAAKDPEKFWADQAERLHWSERWNKALDWSNPPFAKWFIGGKLNLADNCVDRHLSGPRRNKAAIIWEGEDFGQQIVTYQELHRRVAKFSNALKKLDLKARCVSDHPTSG